MTDIKNPESQFMKREMRKQAWREATMQSREFNLWCFSGEVGSDDEDLMRPWGCGLKSLAAVDVDDYAEEERAFQLKVRSLTSGSTTFSRPCKVCRAVSGNAGLRRCAARSLRR